LPKTLAEIAIDGGLVSKADAARAGKLADSKGLPLIVVLVRDLGVDEVALVAAMRRQMRVPLLDPSVIHLEPDALRAVSKDVCERLHVLPVNLGTDGTNARVLRVAMADPTDTAAIAELEQITGCEIEVVALPLSCVEEWLAKGYASLHTAVTRVPSSSGNLMFVSSKLSSTAMHRLAQGESVIYSGDNEISETARVAVRASASPTAPELDELQLRFAAAVRALVAKGLLTEEEIDAQVAEIVAARKGS
jgi:hypothetical protein